MKLQILIALSLAISLAVPFLLGGEDLLQALARTPAWITLSAVCMVAVSWASNAMRLTILARAVEKAVPFPSALSQVIATEFSSAASPAGAGGPITYVLLLSQRDFKTGHAAAMYAVDHLVDGFFFVTMLPLLIVLTAVSGLIPNVYWLPAIAALLFTLGLLVFWAAIYHYRALIAFSGYCLEPLHLSPKRRRILARMVFRFRHGLTVLACLPPAPLFALYLFCAIHWLMRYSILAVVIWGLGFSIPWAYLFIVQGLVLFIGQLTVLPGGSGSVEVGFSALLAPFIDPANSALALLLWRFSTFYWYLIVGAPVFILRAGHPALQALWPKRNKDQ